MIVDKGKYYLYRHIRLDKNEPFYIGIGTKIKGAIATSNLYRRAYNIISRNILWKRIAEKTEFKIEIILESNDYNFIIEKEKEFIALYGRKDFNEGTLSNLTDDGEGRLQSKCSDELKLKHKLSKIGVPRSKEVSEKIRNTVFPIEEREKIKELYKSGLNYGQISKLVSKRRETIGIFLKQEGLVKDKYKIMREDGVKFKTEKEVCFIMKCKRGTVSAVLDRDIKRFGYKWYKINEFIE